MTLWRMWIVGQIDASIAAGLILLIVHAGRSWLSPSVRSALLLIAMVRLILPPFIRSPWSEALVDAPLVDDARFGMVVWLQDDAWRIAAVVGSVIALVLLARLGRSIAISRDLAASGTALSSIAADGIEVRVSSDTRAPLAAGFRQPLIVLPSALVATASREQLDAVVAHEVGHHARRDLYWIALARAGAAIAWFNPLAHLLARELISAREDGCDDWALAKTGSDPFKYAQALLHSARLIASSDEGLLVARAHPMGVRLRRLLDFSSARDRKSTGALVCAIVVTAAIFIPGAHIPDPSDRLDASERVVVVIKVPDTRK